MYVRDYLSGSKEPMPLWLKNYKKGDKLDFDEILSHRVVYYPGSYTDGQAVKTFNNAHYAHTFFYVDYMLKKDYLTMQLYFENGFYGYNLYDLREVTQNELLPRPWTQHYTPSKEDMNQYKYHIEQEKPYCLLAIFDRKEKFGDNHGAERFAVIFLYADGIATYDAMFINSNRTPSVLLFQDHGFGGNYNIFGRGGILEDIAKENNALPEYIMTLEGSEWDGYEKVEDVNYEIGGMYNVQRWLYRKL